MVPSRRRDVISRVCASLIGGYIAASLVSMLIARFLPLPASSATTIGMLCVPFLYLVTILWAFSARSPSQGWLGIGGVSAFAAAMVWASISIGGRL